MNNRRNRRYRDPIVSTSAVSSIRQTGTLDLGTEFVISEPNALSGPRVPRSLEFQLVGTAASIRVSVEKDVTTVSGPTVWQSVFTSRTLPIGSSPTKYVIRIPKSVEMEEKEWRITFGDAVTPDSIATYVVNWAVQF